MPDNHVEILLDCYKYVLQNRMLSSGRLGKGSFQEVTDEMNKRCKVTEASQYERYFSRGNYDRQFTRFALFQLYFSQNQLKLIRIS